MEITNPALQKVAPNGNVTFAETVISGSCSISHREGSGLIKIKGITSGCCNPPIKSPVAISCNSLMLYLLCFVTTISEKSSVMSWYSSELPAWASVALLRMSKILAPILFAPFHVFRHEFFIILGGSASDAEFCYCLFGNCGIFGLFIMPDVLVIYV